VIEGLTDWVIGVVESFGYVGVAFLVALENVFPPIPSEVVLGLAGFVSSRGDAWIVGMIIAATVGSLAGAYVLYGIAAAIGPERLRLLVRQYGKWVRITERDLDRAESWFDRRSNIAVLVCRCIPLVRSLISVPAGFRRMPLVPFTIYTTAGSLVWNSVMIGLGYALGERWERILEYADYFQYVVLVAIAVGLLYIAWYLLRRRPAAT